MKNQMKFALSLVAVASLAACGGGGGGDDTELVSTKAQLSAQTQRVAELSAEINTKNAAIVAADKKVADLTKERDDAAKTNVAAVAAIQLKLDAAIAERNATVKSLNEQIVTLQAQLADEIKKYKDCTVSVEGLSAKFTGSTFTIGTKSDASCVQLQTITADAVLNVKALIAARTSAEGNATVANQNLATLLNAIEAKYGATTGALAARLAAAIVKVESAMTPAAVAGLQTQIIELDAARLKLSADLRVAIDARTALAAELAGANGDKTKLAADLAAVQSQIAALEAARLKITADLTAANADKTKLTADLAAVQSQVTSLNAARIALTADLAAANGDKTKLAADLAAATSTVATLNAQVLGLQSQIGSLEADLGSRLTAAQVAALNAEIDTLKVQLTQSGDAGAVLMAANAARAEAAADKAAAEAAAARAAADVAAAQSLTLAAAAESAAAKTATEEAAADKAAAKTATEEAAADKAAAAAATAKATADVDAANAALATANANAATAEAARAVAVAARVEAETNLAAAQASIVALNAEITALKAAASGDTATLTARIQALETQLASEVGILNAQIRNLEREATALTAALSTANADRAALTAQIAALNAEIADLKASGGGGNSTGLALCVATPSPITTRSTFPGAGTSCVIGYSDQVALAKAFADERAAAKFEGVYAGPTINAMVTIGEEGGKVWTFDETPNFIGTYVGNIDTSNGTTFAANTKTLARGERADVTLSGTYERGTSASVTVGANGSRAAHTVSLTSVAGTLSVPAGTMGGQDRLDGSHDFRLTTAADGTFTGADAACKFTGKFDQTPYAYNKVTITWGADCESKYSIAPGTVGTGVMVRLNGDFIMMTDQTTRFAGFNVPLVVAFNSTWSTGTAAPASVGTQSRVQALRAITGGRN